jgi:phenylalanyl-tRNA synthetase beta chain
MLVFKDSVRDILTGCGMQEIITYSLVSKHMLDKVSATQGIRLFNSLSVEQEYLRISLIPSMLAKVSDNEKHEQSLSLFEIGRIYLSRANDLPDEREILCGAITGERFEKSWQTVFQKVDYYDAKGILEILLERLGVDADFELAEDGTLLAGRTAKIVAGGQTIGMVGQLDPRAAEKYDVSSDPLYLFELELDKLLPLVKAMEEYTPIARFPGSTRDISLLVDIDLPSQKVQDIIQDTRLVSSVTLFDVYTGDKLPAGKKTLAYSVIYQSPERTLTDKEVNKVQEGLLKRLQKTLGVTLRQ